jgi:hypothetical protein
VERPILHTRVEVLGVVELTGILFESWSYRKLKADEHQGRSAVHAGCNVFVLLEQDGIYA